MIHIAGPDLQVDHQLRQRCAWCGALLLDYDLARVAVPAGQDPRPATWETGALIDVQDGVSAVVPYADGDPIPVGACAGLDPEVTT